VPHTELRDHVDISVITESDVPTIGAFNIGNKDELGLDTEESNGQWFLVVKAAQDYETPSQTEYNFFVEAGGSKLEVVIYVYNVDDNAPYFNFPDSASCEISVSNSQFSFVKQLYLTEPSHHHIQHNNSHYKRIQCDYNTKIPYP